MHFVLALVPFYSKNKSQTKHDGGGRRGGGEGVGGGETSQGLPFLLPSKGLFPYVFC